MAKAFHRRTLAWLAAAAAASALAAAPAHAQWGTVAAGGLSWAKTEAVLGAPSALEAILAQQNGLPAPSRATLPASPPMSPLLAAAVRERAAIAPGVASGRPDVFGSVALPIGPTRLNARWTSVEQARLGGAPARYAQSLSDLDAVAQLDAVNRYVNQRVRFVDDQRQHGRADVWSAAAATLTGGRGDCEDYAIAKLQMLRRAGFSDRNLYLVIVKDLVTRSDHAVLVVRAGGRMHVLDNGTDRVLDSENMRDYRPILTFAAGRTWTHGYRVRSAPVNVASADDKAMAPLTPGSENQRSWSASLLALNTGLSK